MGHIVRLQQLLRRWRHKAASKTCVSPCKVPSDVPLGHVALTVGASRRRFVVRATYLNHPLFKNLLNQAEEEFGFANQAGPLAIPCDEYIFEEMVRFLARSESIRFNNLEEFQRHFSRSLGVDFLHESRPFLYGVEKSSYKNDLLVKYLSLPSYSDF
ncbi:hypothetical protein GIB67_019506 [Kingdonia uniflora]|uniref:Uncharacterized protein n=1 Tax=Kingdonia uniflora TaxID=39325 RepID=A0A7J7N0A5_9MAGN|nr:hypothetical protein GIB67_019506 [Kingdonia uniflora]